MRSPIPSFPTCRSRFPIGDHNLKHSMAHCIGQWVFASGGEADCSSGTEPVNGASSLPAQGATAGAQSFPCRNAAGSASDWAAPVGKNEKSNLGYSVRWTLVVSATRCDLVVRFPQISLGNIYEKCQGEAGGWRSPLPSPTWLSTPNSSLTSLACEHVCERETDRVNV